MATDPCAGPGATHHEACLCRERAIARLCALADLAANVLSCVVSPIEPDLRAAVAEVRGPREERKDG